MTLLPGLAPGPDLQGSRHTIFLGKCDISVCFPARMESESSCHHQSEPDSFSRLWECANNGLLLWQAGLNTGTDQPTWPPRLQPQPTISNYEISAAASWTLTACQAHTKRSAQVSSFILPHDKTRWSPPLSTSSLNTLRHREVEKLVPGLIA